MTQQPLSALPTIYSEQLNYTLPFVQHPFTFTFSHLADAFIQSDLQLGST